MIKKVLGSLIVFSVIIGGVTVSQSAEYNAKKMIEEEYLRAGERGQTLKIEFRIPNLSSKFYFQGLTPISALFEVPGPEIKTNLLLPETFIPNSTNTVSFLLTNIGDKDILEGSLTMEFKDPGGIGVKP